MYQIYIPICFYYFASIKFIIFLVALFTFQYVSIISESVEKTDYRHYNIYIPICFYYFVSLRHPLCISPSIYIPICFYYFITFIASSEPPLSFTFQYVSIISLHVFVRFRIKSYLHSNMFLLFLIMQNNIFRGCNIYIPICFYYF